MKHKVLYAGIAALFATSPAWAVPVLQVSAPAGAGDTGIYADYQANSTDPTETNTAIISGNTLYVAGVYQNNNVVSLGGKAGDDNWSDFLFPTVFDSRGALLLVSVPEGSLADAVSSLTVNGNFAFYTDTTLSFFPNSHDPVQVGVADFLFFDIGNFSKTAGIVPDFASETGAGAGQIKTLTLGGFDAVTWAHFDVMALETNTRGQTRLQTSLQNNPGSHDVTWKSDGPPPQELPEPATLALLGLGLLGLGVSRRYKK